MAIEIERKFLINPKEWEKVDKPEGLRCRQFYLHNEVEKVVRVRVIGKKAFITIKGKGNGISKPEYEYEIPVTDAEEMIKLFSENLIDKTRYLIPTGNHTWEIDVFHGVNKGLIIAEIELSSEDENFENPSWIVKEVTGNKKYYNAYIEKHPFSKWK